LRKTGKLVIWPLYFNAEKTRSEGRRVPEKFAVKSPKTDLILKAAENLKLNPSINRDAAHPRNRRDITGYILVDKKDSKTKTLKKLAKEIKNLSSK